MRPWVSSIPALLAGIILSACMSQPLVTDSPNLGDQPRGANAQSIERWQLRRQRLLALTDWNISGKVGVRSGKKGDSARLLWARDDERHDIQIYGPLGGGRVRLLMTPAGAELRDKKANVERAATASILLQNQLGWRVPFDELMWWVKGLPAPGTVENYSLDNIGLLQTLTQLGWQVQFNSYRNWDGIVLPQKLTLIALPGVVSITDDDGPREDLTVRVVIRRWQMPRES